MLTARSCAECHFPFKLGAEPSARRALLVVDDHRSENNITSRRAVIEKAQMASRAQRVLAALQESQDCRGIEDALLRGPPVGALSEREASLARPRRISVECEWFG